MYGQLNSDQIVLEKNCLWDMIRINWKEVFVTLNGAILKMPKTVKIPLEISIDWGHLMINIPCCCTLC